MSGDTLRAKLVEADLARQAGTERVDVALAVFAEWLREQARKELNVHETAHSRALRRVHNAEVLTELADSISPKEQERD